MAIWIYHTTTTTDGKIIKYGYDDEKKETSGIGECQIIFEEALQNNK